MDKKVLLIGDTIEVQELAAALRAQAQVNVVPSVKTALTTAQQLLPDAIAFVVPVYWENLLPFLEAIRADARLERKPIVYIGTVLEGTDQIMLARKGVHVVTLGPVPMNEVARYILDLA